jgi:hypothetical protein
MIPMAVDTSLLTGLSAAMAVAAGVVVGIDALRHHRMHIVAGAVSTRSLALEAWPRAGLDPSFILERAESEDPSAPLEGAIATGDVTRVLNSLAALNVYVLGHISQEAAKQAGAAGRQFLQVEAIDEEAKRLLLPVFTQRSVLRSALIGHPDWLEQSVIELKGSEVMRVLTAETWLLIDPWSSREFAVRPTDELEEPIEGRGEASD